MNGNNSGRKLPQHLMIRWISLMLLFLTFIALSAAAKTFVIAIEIHEYEDERISDLPLIEGEGVRFANALLQQTGINASDVALLSGAEATRDAIEGAIFDIGQRCSSEDSLIFYFTGHGSTTPDTNRDEFDGDGVDEVLLPYDADLDRPLSLITDDIFGSWIMSYVGSDNILIILDSCHSGGQGKSVQSTHDSKSLGTVSKDVFTDPAFRERAVSVLSACSPAEKAYVEEAFGGSVFTYFLVEAMTSHAGSADTDCSGSVSLEEAEAYILLRIQEYVEENPNKQQSPYLANMAKPYPFELVPAIAQFSDPKLEVAVRNELGIDAESPLLKCILADVETLRIPDQGIYDLRGLEYAVNLRILDASGNLVQDVAPLANLGKLSTVNLESNQISDLSPLVGSPLSKSGPEFYVARNPIGGPLGDTKMIDQLIEEGFYIDFTPQKRVLFLNREDNVLARSIRAIAEELSLQLVEVAIPPEQLVDYDVVIFKSFPPGMITSVEIDQLLSLGKGIVLVGEAPYLIAQSTDLSGIASWFGATGYTRAIPGGRVVASLPYPLGLEIPQAGHICQIPASGSPFPVCLNLDGDSVPLAVISDTAITTQLVYAFQHLPTSGKVYFQSNTEGFLGEDHASRELLRGGIEWALEPTRIADGKSGLGRDELPEQEVFESLATVVSVGSTCGYISISWDARVEEEIYDVQRATNEAGPFESIAAGIPSVGTDRNVWNDYYASPCQDYWYRVIAHRPDGSRVGSVTRGWASECTTACEDASPSLGSFQETFDSGKINENVWSYVHPPEHRTSVEDGVAIIDAIDDWTQGSGIVTVSSFISDTTVSFDFTIEQLLCPNGGQNVAALSAGGLHWEFGHPVGPETLQLYASCDGDLYVRTRTGDLTYIGVWSLGEQHHIQLDVQPEAVMVHFDGREAEVPIAFDSYRLWFGGHIHRAVFDNVHIQPLVDDVASVQASLHETSNPDSAQQQEDGIERQAIDGFNRGSPAINWWYSHSDAEGGTLEFNALRFSETEFGTAIEYKYPEHGANRTCVLQLRDGYSGVDASRYDGI